MDLTELNAANLNRHPWELSRAKSILGLVKGQLGNSKCADIGSGDLYFAGMLHKLSQREILAVDVFAPDNLSATGIKVVRQMSEIPLDAGLDRVFMLDVLEHVPDENAFLHPIIERLAPDAVVVVTVPAHQWLFSEHDRFLKHFRRYDKAGLVEVLTRNGLEIENTFYFYSSLFCVRVLNKMLGKLGFKRKSSKPPGIGNWAFASKHPVTKILEFALNADFWICRKVSELGITVPGLSLCILCKKNSA